MTPGPRAGTIEGMHPGRGSGRTLALAALLGLGSATGAGGCTETTAREPGPPASRRARQPHGDEASAAPRLAPPPARPAPPPPATGVDCDAISRPLAGRRSFYESNPTYEDPREDASGWVLAAPGERGLDGARLERAANRLAALPFSRSLLVLRDDALVLERYFHGGSRRASLNVHSASKSILSTAVGIAIERGLFSGVDQPLAELLPSYFARLSDPRKRRITLRHLLTMTAGLRWTEDRTEDHIERAGDWVGAILALPQVAEPGRSFEYSTGLTHLLSAALSEASGTSTCALVHRYLLEPLEISAERWGRDPQGYHSGGYNLYLTARELARFGLLVLHDGRWNGRELVSARWLREATTPQVSAGDGYGYGYGWWTRDLGGHAAVVAWGHGGQMLYVLRELGLVVVMTTDTADHAADFDGASIVLEHVIPAVRDAGPGP